MVGYSEIDTLSPNEKVLAGTLAGFATRFVVQPLDLIKVRIQLQKLKKNKKPNFFVLTRRVIKEEGIKAFWQGHTIGQIYTIFNISSQFWAYEMATKFAAKYSFFNNHKVLSSASAGFYAGFVSSVLTAPIEVIRTRQMIDGTQYAGLFKAFMYFYRKEGFFAFYKGLPAQIMMTAPALAMVFPIFTFIQPSILNYLESSCKSNCEPEKGNLHKPENLLLATSLAGSVASFVAKTVTYPFDLTKRRLQISAYKPVASAPQFSTTKRLRSCNKMSECLKKIVKREGLLGLFRGFIVSTVKAQLTSVVSFTTYEMICYSMRNLRAAEARKD